MHPGLKRHQDYPHVAATHGALPTVYADSAIRKLLSAEQLLHSENTKIIPRTVVVTRTAGATREQWLHSENSKCIPSTPKTLREQWLHSEHSRCIPRTVVVIVVPLGCHFVTLRWRYGRQRTTLVDTKHISSFVDNYNLCTWLGLWARRHMGKTHEHGKTPKTFREQWLYSENSNGYCGISTLYIYY